MEMLIFDSWEQREELRLLRALSEAPLAVAPESSA